MSPPTDQRVRPPRRSKPPRNRDTQPHKNSQSLQFLTNRRFSHLTARFSIDGQRDTVTERKQHVSWDAKLGEQRAENAARDTEDAVESRARSDAVALVWENHGTQCQYYREESAVCQLGTCKLPTIAN